MINQKNKAIEVKDLVKTFGEKRAVDKLSFTVEKRYLDCSARMEQGNQRL